MTCKRCQCRITVRLILVLLVSLSLNNQAEGQGSTKFKGLIVPGESVSPELNGKDLQLLFDGVADLYHQTDGATNYFYIKDGNGRLFTISVPQKPDKETNLSSRQGAISVLKVIMHDAPEMIEQIESSELDKHKLAALMHDYHISISGSDEGIEYELPPPALLPHVGFFAGYNADFLKDCSTVDLNGIKLDPAFYTIAGISVRAFLPRISRNLSLTIDLSAGKRYVYGYLTSFGNSELNTDTYKELHLHNYLIMSDLLVGYSFRAGDLKPFVSGGICTRNVVSDKSRIETDVNYNDLVIFSDTEDYITEEKTSLGVMLAMGVYLNVSKQISLSVTVNYSELIISPAFRNYRSAGLTIGVNY